DLSPGRDQGHEHDQSDQGEDERVLDHALSGLPRKPWNHEIAESLTVEPPNLIAAATIAFSTTTRTIRLRQKWARSALSRGLGGLAERRAAPARDSRPRRFPGRNSAAAPASSGCEATAESAMRQPLTTSPSMRSHTAAPAIGKSIEPRRRSFT